MLHWLLMDTVNVFPPQALKLCPLGEEAFFRSRRLQVIEPRLDRALQLLRRECRDLLAAVARPKRISDRREIFGWHVLKLFRKRFKFVLGL